MSHVFILGAPQMTYANGHYVIYYSTVMAGSQDLHIGVSTAPHPEGPWTASKEPIVGEPGIWSIAPAVITDRKTGDAYLLYKDFYHNSPSHRGYGGIRAWKLDSDRTSVVGTATKLFGLSYSWEGGVVEGPYGFRHGRYYYIFY